MKQDALRVARTPQSAVKRLDIRVNNIDVNQIVKTVVFDDPITKVAANQLDVPISRKMLRGIEQQISWILGVFVSPKSVYPDDGIEEIG